MTRIAGISAVLALACWASACGGSDDGADGEQGARTSSAQVGAVDRDNSLHRLLPAEIRKAGTVRVASDIPYPPFIMYVEEGSKDLTGFDYDLGQALGARLGVKFAFRQQKFDGIIPGLAARKYDVAIADMSDNAERRRVVDFIDYVQSGTGLMVKKGNPAGLKTYMDLCGKTATLQSGAAQVAYVKQWQEKCKQAGKPPIEVVLLPKAADSQLALTTGKADAYVSDIPGAAYMAKTVANGTAYDVIDDPSAVGGYDPVPVGIAVLKGNDQLVKAIQRALQSLMDDGTYEQILNKYGLGAIAIPKATVNAG